MFGMESNRENHTRSKKNRTAGNWKTHSREEEVISKSGSRGIGERGALSLR